MVYITCHLVRVRLYTSLSWVFKRDTVHLRKERSKAVFRLKLISVPDKVVLYDSAIKVDYVLGFTSWVMYMVLFVGAGAICCKYISKQAMGSGIPELKVIMNGFVLPNYLTLPTLVAKMLSLIAILGCGMPMGKEGPFVHMGAIIANLLSKITSSFRHNAFYANEGRHMELLSRGCAVGIACTFSSPAGAVLYGIESTHKYFSVKSYWPSFFATTCASLLFRFATHLIIPRNIAAAITAYYQTNFPTELFVAEEVPVFVFVGVLSGLMGALFLVVYKRFHTIVKTNKNFLMVFGKSGVGYTILAAFFIAVMTFPDGLGRFFHGRYTFQETLRDLLSNCSMVIRNGSTSCGDDMIKRWTVDSAVGTSDIFLGLLRYFLIMFVFVPLCLTLSVPSGIFIPAFVNGAVGGRMLGELMALIFPNGIRGPDGPQIYPGLYAVVGAAAYTGAVTHSLSIAVIVCETTGQLGPLLPVLIALMIGNAISSFLQPSIYEVIIMLKKYPHLVDLPPSRKSVYTVKVEQIMVRDVVYISKNTTYKELRELLISTPQLRSYPLVTNDGERILLGSVARRYLNLLVTIHLGHDPALYAKKRSMTNIPMQIRNSFVGGHLLGHTLLSSSPLHDGKELTVKNTPLRPNRSDPNFAVGDKALMEHASTLEQPIDIDSLAIDSAPFQLVLGTSLYKVHQLFSLLALNHAYVTHRGRLVGVVALRELRLALADIYMKGVTLNDEFEDDEADNYIPEIDDAEVIRGDQPTFVLPESPTSAQDDDGSGISISASTARRTSGSQEDVNSGSETSKHGHNDTP
uniref:Chloride channel protein n=1 Tax=Bursaphelenchus xylophilus TaxID=6326 RepID=A0A1I7SES9_BURXY